jgi:hypothetical protein
LSWIQTKAPRADGLRDVSESRATKKFLNIGGWSGFRASAAGRYELSAKCLPITQPLALGTVPRQVPEGRKDSGDRSVGVE